MQITAFQAVLGLSFFGSVKVYGRCDGLWGFDKEVFSGDVSLDESLQDCESGCTDMDECKSYEWFDNGFYSTCTLYSEPVVEDLIYDTTCYIRANDGTDSLVKVGDGWCKIDGYENCIPTENMSHDACVDLFFEWGFKYMEIGGSGCVLCGGDGTPPSEIAEAVCANKASTPPTEPPTEPAVVAPAEFDITLSDSPGCAFTAGTVNIGTITCSFVTKGAAGYTVDSTLYNADCSTAAPNPGQPGVSLDKSDDEFNRQPNGGKQYESNYVVTIPILNSAAAEGSTSIEICLKTEVRDMNGDVYDWTHTKITKGIDINGGFSTENSLSTVTFDGDASDKNLEESSFGVGINRCDENGVEVNNGATLAVGENFFLCVKGSQSQVVISNIKEMTATKTDPTLSLSIVTEVDDGSGEGTSNSNTFVYGNGQNKVVIATRLPAIYFASDGPVTFSGSANIVVGNEVSPDTRRRLSRSMQVASASSEESANFSMVIQVAGMDDASSASAIKTIAAMFFAAAVAALIV